MYFNGLFRGFWCSLLIYGVFIYVERTTVTSIELVLHETLAVLLVTERD